MWWMETGRKCDSLVKAESERDPQCGWGSSLVMFYFYPGRTVACVQGLLLLGSNNALQCLSGGEVSPLSVTSLGLAVFMKFKDGHHLLMSQI